MAKLKVVTPVNDVPGDMIQMVSFVMIKSQIGKIDILGPKRWRECYACIMPYNMAS